jgi:serine protease Do
MSRRFAFVTLALTAFVAFLVGAIFAVSGGQATVTPETAAAAPTGLPREAPVRSPQRVAISPVGVPIVNFADVVDRINPAVVNIDATTRGRDPRSRRTRVVPEGPGTLDGPGGLSPRFDLDTPRRGEGSGFIIDPDGHILTNNHVIDRAERITVKLSNGRTVRARVVGSDPDTDIALIKVDGQPSLPVAPLGDSSMLRMGEWVVAIGDPLGYEHSVTVGVVSYIGRKLFDASLDSYIQTDAAINFGNSGGPLINGRGEVIGINAAISARGSSIGFAVPINIAASILPQLRASGRVSRGYIGVALTAIDGDLQRSLRLPTRLGALVQDVTAGSPAERSGLRPYDVIVALDGRSQENDHALIRDISAQPPGTTVRLRILREGREQDVLVKLAERPSRERALAQATPARGRSEVETPLGVAVRDLDRLTTDRMNLPSDTRGVLITRVEPLSSASDGGINRGAILLEINRQRVASVDDYHRIARAAKPGEVLTFFLYSPDLDQRQLKTVRVEDR